MFKCDVTQLTRSLEGNQPDYATAKNELDKISGPE